MAGSRTRVNCLEGSYANRYTTNACCVSAVYLLTKYRAWQQVKVNKCPYSVLLAIRKEHLLTLRSLSVRRDLSFHSDFEIQEIKFSLPKMNCFQKLNKLEP